MNPKGVTVFLLLLPLLPHLNTSTVWAEDIITPKDFTFNLYLYKSTLVTYTVLVSPSQVNVNILLPGSSYSDVLVSDINGAPLRFNVTKNSVSVLTLGTSSVSVNYLTNTLISSTDGLMAFNVTTNIPSTIILPKSSAMISTNVVPLEITTKDQQTTLVLPAGNLSLVFTSQSSPSDGQGRTLIQDLVLPLLIMVVLIIALTLLITKTKKSKRSIN